nr:MAG TPA: hypothetical protein [Caudoviricetes sp.]
MAEEKKSYIMYKSWNPLLESLPPEQLYEVFHAIIKYQNGEETNIKDPVIQAIFKMLKAQFEEDDNKWEKERQQRIDAGRKGGKAKPTEYKECLAEVSEAKECLAPLSKVKQTQANQAVMVEVEVEGNVEVEDILPPYNPPKGGEVDSSLRSESRQNIDDYTPPKPERTDYQGVLDAYHECCPSFPAVIKLTEARKRAIKARLKDYGLEEIKRAFNLAGQSDFLKGSSGWQASFDWLMKPANMTKVLEGNYTNRASPAGGKSKSMWGEDDFVAKVIRGETSLAEEGWFNGMGKVVDERGNPA